LLCFCNLYVNVECIYHIDPPLMSMVHLFEHVM